MKHIVYKVVAIVSILSLLLGLFGCGGNKKYTIDDIVLVHTGYYGMESNPVYSFAMRKEEDNWFSPQAVVWGVIRTIIRRSVLSR